MFICDISIKRPVLATVFSLLLLIFGVVGYTRLPVRELPSVDFPVVSVTTSLRGANPEIIEEEITDPIEEEINTVEGIKKITSVSSEGASMVTAEFELNRNVDIAAQDVRDKVSRIRRSLPNDIDEPVIEKLDLDAFAVMWIAVNSDVMEQADLTYYADRTLKTELQKVPGVGSIIIGGEKRFAVRIWLDSDKLAARELAVSDVVEALQKKNAALPSGRIEGLAREFTVKTEGELESIEAFNELIIEYQNGTPTRLKDVGYAKEGVENERDFARFDGRTAVGLGILKQTQANTVDVCDGVKKRLVELESRLPEGVGVAIAYDQSDFISQSIDEVKETLVQAGLLVVLVIFLFLRNVRSTIIPGIAMMISVISTFAAMYFLGFTLNNFTLLALVLCVGIVVDDAIVMIENIYRHVEEGEDPMTAAFRGSKEIAFAVVTTTVTLVIVFLPVAFMKGQVGKFFYEFGITVSVAVAISSFVALTLSPMMCSRILRHKTEHSKMYNVLESGYAWLENHYKTALTRALKHKVLVLAVGLVAFIASGYLFGMVGKEFVSSEDRGSFLIMIEGPEGSSLDYTGRYVEQVEDILHGDPEIQSYFSAVGLAMGRPADVNRGIFFVTMSERSTRRHQDEIIAELRGKLYGITGIMAFPVSWNPLSQGEGRAFQYILRNPDFEELAEYSEEYMERLKQIPGFVDVDMDLKLNKPEVKVYIDRDRAAALGVNVQDVANTLNVLLGGSDYTKFKARGERYDVILQLVKDDRLTPEVLDRIYLRADDDRRIKLSNVVRVEEGVGPSAINRYERVRAVKIESNLDGITLAEAVAKADNLAKEMLPAGFTTGVTGQAEEMADAFQSLLLTFLLAIILIYLVLSAQFESFLYPISVMTALPLSTIGAVGALLLFGMTLNIYSIIGMIMLMGLVTKNSILLVEFTNKLRADGVDCDNALEEAGRVRLRPILMTALSTIIGILPIALGLGAGSEARRPMGAAVVGGMVTSTVLTLFVVPALYSVLNSITVRMSRLFKRAA